MTESATDKAKAEEIAPAATAPPPGAVRASPGGPLARLARTAGVDGLLALLLFASLATLSWRRWASFSGDLNREWTTPARVAAGERLYRDVSWYYGPLAPWAEGAAFLLFGSRVGTAVAFDLATAAGTLALVLLASRRFLPTAGRAALAATAAGVACFAPENGSLVACYSQSALLAVGLSWGAFLLAGSGRAAAGGLSAGAALLAKAEALPALLVAGALLPRRRALFAALALLVAAAGYGVACAGLPVEELVRYGPLRHFRIPPEFRELYLRVSGLHPSLLGRGAAGAAAGSLLAAGWLLGAGGLLAGRSRRAAVGGVLLAGGLALSLAGPFPREPLVTTLFRSLPILSAAALVLAAVRLRDPERPEAERAAAAAAAGAAAIGLSFAWRTVLWTVPAFPYAPLAALSCLPSAAWLWTAAAPEAVPSASRGRASWLLALPLLLSPLLFLPRLVSFYRSPRTEVSAPRGTWVPPGDEGALFGALVSRLEKEHLADGQLVVLPEASALNFLLGTRSPLRLEQLLPGHLDDVADADAARLLRDSPPRVVVLIPRATPEFGAALLGRDYGRLLAAEISRSYVVAERIPPPSGDGREALVLRRRGNGS